MTTSAKVTEAGEGDSNLFPPACAVGRFAFAAGATPGVTLTARDSRLIGLTSAGNHTELAHVKLLDAASVDFN